eukprot:TRINITY_DN83459_c0_g1_i1.p1 TRINITY_DN83459_c0_g1~~TRINITY_DN83459_c0_g1_i1.p1  ORF type:complete len:237 (-),score=38.76 TRINITY_DN83459_c0_g1_i1:110-820(-)
MASGYEKATDSSLPRSEMDEIREMRRQQYVNVMSVTIKVGLGGLRVTVPDIPEDATVAYLLEKVKEHEPAAPSCEYQIMYGTRALKKDEPVPRGSGDFTAVSIKDSLYNDLPKTFQGVINGYYYGKKVAKTTLTLDHDGFKLDFDSTWKVHDMEDYWQYDEVETFTATGTWKVEGEYLVLSGTSSGLHAETAGTGVKAGRRQLGKTESSRNALKNQSWRAKRLESLTRCTQCDPDA